LVNTIYWDPKAPIFFTKADMREANFKVKTIADITCDIDGSIPSTIRASSIANPFYGFNPFSETETKPFIPESIDVMAVDNLPCELPRDASREFSYNLLQYVMDKLIRNPEDEMIRRASICRDGELTAKFSYLEDYVTA